MAVDAPCAPWIESWGDDVVYCCAKKVESVAEPVQEQIIAYVSEVLWRKTGKRFGVCTHVRRPCGQCTCGTYPCTCRCVQALDLGHSPVVEVTEVKIDGVALASSAYRVDDVRWLVRLDGGTWPRCPDLTAASDAEGSFLISWSAGVEVPDGGQRAAAKFACELAKRSLGLECEIPDKVTNITREGVTMSFLPPIQQVLERQATGIYEVDIWVDAVNHEPAPAPRLVDPLSSRTIGTG